MARTVDEVTASIDAENDKIVKQQALVESMQKQIDENNQEYEALKKQKETLDITYSEIESLYSSLCRECSSVKEAFGSNNGFANGYGDVMQQNIENIKSTTLKKISDMIERIQNQMTNCDNLLRTASDKLADANNAIINAKNKVVTFNQELQQAEEEALIETGI